MNNINKTIYDIIVLESQISNEIDCDKKLILLDKLLKIIKILNNITEQYIICVEEEKFKNCTHIFENYCEKHERTKQICNICNMLYY